MASVKGKKTNSDGKGKTKAGNVQAKLDKFLQSYKTENFTRVFGDSFLSSGYSLEQGIDFALTSKTVSLGFLKKILSSVGKWNKTIRNFDDCDKVLNG